MHPKIIFNKFKILSFFQKRGPRGQKMKILKKYFQNRKGLQKLDIKHVLHSPRDKKKFFKIFDGQTDKHVLPII